MDIQDKQLYTAYNLYFSNLKPDANTIRTNLESIFGSETISIETIAKWLQQFDQIPEKERRQEESYHWDYLEYYEIEWTNGRQVNELYEKFQSWLRTTEIVPVGNFQGDIPISGREMKWIWRISLRDSSDGSFNFSRELMNSIWEEAVEKAVDEQQRKFLSQETFIEWRSL